jgi:hypothetical protein
MSALSCIAWAPHRTKQVYQRLLHAICDGELAPSARLRQEELAAVLNGLATRNAVLAKAQLDFTVIAEGGTDSAWQRIGPMINADMKFHHLIYIASAIRSSPKLSTITGATSVAPWVRCCKP